jgi:Flp pilus assembly protein TadG
VFRRSDGAAAVDFVLLTVPLLFTTLLTMRVIWLGYERAQLTVIATRTAAFAGLADTTTVEAETFAKDQVRLWLGASATAEVTRGDFASASIQADGLEVQASAISELY